MCKYTDTKDKSKCCNQDNPNCSCNCHGGLDD